MPDLKSQLAEVKHKLATMAFDDSGEATDATEAPTPIANQSRTLWLTIKNHPSSTAAEIAQLAGVDRASASTLTSQMFIKGILTRTKASDDSAYRYSVADPNYVPMSKQQAIERAAAAKLAIKSKKAKAKAKTKAAVAAPTPAAPPDISVHDLLNTMSITKARALYDELKKIFGG
jgi:predicted transcriptional regulator